MRVEIPPKLPSGAGPAGRPGRTRGRCPTLREALALLLTTAVLAPAVAVAPAEPAASGSAIQVLRDGWRVLHCGVARGVLYLTYADRGRAAIAPAVPNAAIAKACADAGHPLGAGVGQRGALDAVQPAAPAASRARLAAPAPADRSQPAFTPFALGGSLNIDARNDSDIAWRCNVSFSWTFDDNRDGPRSANAQATLPPRQNNRVASVSGDYRNIRFVGAPSWFCSPAE